MRGINDAVRIGDIPWGIGALMVGSAPEGWVCPGCHKKPKKGDGVHYYPFAISCTACARAALAEFWRPAPIEPAVPPGQLVMW